MGIGASIKLNCPNDYDKNKFNMILKLYDRLDSNGDQVIETRELIDIANLHIENRMTFINDSLSNDYQLKLNIEHNRYTTQLGELNRKYKKNIENINTTQIKKSDNLQNELTLLKNMSENDKCKTFLKVVSNGKHIDFWKFFEYMKGRTGDIKNIKS